MSKEAFKQFVRNKPNLVDYVNKNEVTWQNLYEMYELYGENSEVWDKYKNNRLSSKDLSIRELISMVKGMDIDKVRQGIDGVQKAIGLIQDLGVGNKNSITNNYQARPIYRHFDD